MACFHHLIEHAEGSVPCIPHGCTSLIVLKVDINTRVEQECSDTADLIFLVSLFSSNSQMQSSITRLVVEAMNNFSHRSGSSIGIEKPILLQPQQSTQNCYLLVWSM